MNEATKQFEEVFDKHNDPDERMKQRIKQIRDENLKKIKTDMGL